MSVDLFKLAAPHFLTYLCKLVNKSFRFSIFPDLLKHATKIPIFKTGDKNYMSNFRPMSILLFLSKIFQKCLLTRLIKFLDKFSVITPNQYGFMKGKSTQDALLASTDHIYHALDNRQSSNSVFESLSRAFDTVD